MNITTRPSIVIRYQRLVDITRDLASTLNLDTLLNRIVHAAADLSMAEEASILLYDETNHQLFFQTATNMKKSMVGIAVPLENSIAGQIITGEKPLIVDNVSTKPQHFSKISDATKVQTQSLLGVPLIAKGKVIGVLEAINKVFGKFTIEDQDLLTALGAQAAIAIENARLFQQSDLIAEMVHELRTPLSSLTMATRFLDRPGVSQEQKDEMLTIIQQETARLSDMTTSFLDLARLESGRTQFNSIDFDFNKLVKECVLLMEKQAAEKGISIETEIAPNFPLIYGDQSKLKQVLINLLSNAIKYNRPQGKITIQASAEADGLLINISDTGWGISPEELPHMFEKFFRAPSNSTKAGGTGLGLAISKKIIESHGGRIEVSSQIQKGTTFSIHLPHHNS